MTMVNPGTTKRVTGIALILVSMLLAVLYTTISNWPLVNAAPGGNNSPVTGSVTITEKAGDQVTVTFKNLVNVPAGTHAAHLHKGSCSLDIPTPGQPTSGAAAILDAKNIVVLGTFKAGAGGALASKKFQAKAPANVLAGGWFVCVHAGSLADVANAANAVDQLGKDIKQKKKELAQIVCKDIPEVGKTTETFKINGAAKQ
jgi:hypothetical protein